MQTRPTVRRRLCARPGVDLQRIAGFEHERVFQAQMAQMLRELGVLRQLPVFAVHRNEIARPHQIQHQSQLFRAAVARDVDGRIHACRISRPRRGAKCD